MARQRSWPARFCITNSPDDLADKARSAVAVGQRRLLVLGGDGTFQVLLNAVFGCRDLIVGMIPAGGGNDVATALGLPNHPLHAAEILLDGQCSPFDVVRVRFADGSERLYAGGGGVGIDAEASRYAAGIFRSVPGRFRYVLSALRALLGFRSMPVRVSFSASDPTEISTTAFVVAVLNTPSYGAGVHLAPDASPHDGALDLVVLKNLNVVEILALLPALAFKGELKTDQLRRFRVNCVRIETAWPCSFHGDGEIFGMTPVEVSVVPGAFTVLCGTRSK